MIRRKRVTRRLPRESRTIPVRGFGEEQGEFWHCWYCGFINKEGRTALGDSQSRSGLNYADYSVTAKGATGDGDLSSALAVLDSDIEHYQVALELDSNGDPKEISHVLASDISIGCPMCGSLNSRGDFP
jgi:hypothetical protein